MPRAPLADTYYDDDREAARDHRPTGRHQRSGSLPYMVNVDPTHVAFESLLSKYHVPGSEHTYCINILMPPLLERQQRRTLRARQEQLLAAVSSPMHGGDIGCSPMFRVAASPGAAADDSREDDSDLVDALVAIGIADEQIADVLLDLEPLFPAEVEDTPLPPPPPARGGPSGGDGRRSGEAMSENLFTASSGLRGNRRRPSKVERAIRDTAWVTGFALSVLLLVAVCTGALHRKNNGAADGGFATAGFLGALGFSSSPSAQPRSGAGDNGGALPVLVTPGLPVVPTALTALTTPPA